MLALLDEAFKVIYIGPFAFGFWNAVLRKYSVELGVGRLVLVEMDWETDVSGALWVHIGEP